MSMGLRLAVGLLFVGVTGCSNAGSAPVSADAGAPAPTDSGVPDDAACVHIASTTMESVGVIPTPEAGGVVDFEDWLVTWKLPDMGSQLQLWIRSDTNGGPQVGTCVLYTGPLSLEMECPGPTDPHGPLAWLGVYPLPCTEGAGDAGCVLKPRYLMASGSFQITAVAPGVAKWAGRIAGLKLVESEYIPDLNGSEGGGSIVKKGGRCYIIDDATWDSR